MRPASPSHSAATIVAVALDAEIMGLVRETLAAEAVLPNSSIAYAEAEEVITRTLPDVVIVGYKDPGAAADLAKRLDRAKIATTLVAAGTHSDAGVILSAIRAGYREFVVLPAEAERLREVVQMARSEGVEEGAEQGLVCTVIGAKGGVGATMVATHIAAELSGIHRVLCIDANFRNGDMAPMMDLTSKDSIADLLARADNVDERMLSGAVAVHGSKVHFLTQPEEQERIGEVRAEDLYNIYTSAARAYQYVVIDAGSHLDEPAQLAASVADQILLIATPDVVSVRNAHKKLQTLQNAGIDKARIHLILNQVPAKPHLSQDDIEQNLEVQVMARLPADPATVSQALNDGVLIREINKKSEVARMLSALIGLLTENPEEAQPIKEVGASKGFLASLFGR